MRGSVETLSRFSTPTAVDRDSDLIGIDPAAHTVVVVRLADLFPVLAEALGNNHIWLGDFRDEPIGISNDLYEVVLAFKRLRAAA